MHESAQTIHTSSGPGMQATKCFRTNVTRSQSSVPKVCAAPPPARANHKLHLVQSQSILQQIYRGTQHFHMCSPGCLRALCETMNRPDWRPPDHRASKAFNTQQSCATASQGGQTCRQWSRSVMRNLQQDFAFQTSKIDANDYVEAGLPHQMHGMPAGWQPTGQQSGARLAAGRAVQQMKAQGARS